MTRKRAIQIIFLGLALLTFSFFYALAFSDDLEDCYGAHCFNTEYWHYVVGAEAVSVVICLLGVYFLVTAPKDPN